MSDEKFEFGKLEIIVEKVEPEQASDRALPGEWDDGFAAFSNREKPLAKLEPSPERLFWDRRDTFGMEGWLMEANLWRNKDGLYEEICLEREDDGIFVQHWKLATGVAEEAADCLYRTVELVAGKPVQRGGDVFTDGRIRAMEIVYPKSRLHIFMTIGGNHGQRQDI